MIFNYFENEKKLLYHEHGSDEIPEEIIAEFSGKDVTQVDFSSNSLVSLDCISRFAMLREVILDNNFLSDATIFPKHSFPNITLLSLNNNKLENLNQLLDNLVRCFPNVRYLSLLGNPLCPAIKLDFVEEDNEAYRLDIISRLPKLRFLDAKPVHKNEIMSIKQRETNSKNDQEGAQSTVPTESEQSEDGVEKIGGMMKFFGFRKKKENVPRSPPENRVTYNPLPSDEQGSSSQTQTPRVAYGKMKNTYEGSQSQGNRFILNQDL
ncbi:CLUMA_CG001810, isoform A [Clunio marinus]|uniref:CLUMA_CG001810, isoform A n=1 Tax=Clunio marinus TaxID=568069 RepID=A0A1J1HIZ2_9DIPT|nr:CLUMA_CG001810, isoform A [Clunio marinus]